MSGVESDGRVSWTLGRPATHSESHINRNESGLNVDCREICA